MEDGVPSGSAEGPSEARAELVRLSLSPASSPDSLTSEEDFDPLVTATDHATPPTLGLRELASMRRHDKAAQKARAKPSTSLLSGTSASATAAAAAAGGIQLLKAMNPTDDQLPFASDVEIKGWRIVGGKSWTDQARVGAYVGKATSCRSIPRSKADSSLRNHHHFAHGDAPPHEAARRLLTHTGRTDDPSSPIYRLCPLARCPHAGLPRSQDCHTAHPSQKGFQIFGARAGEQEGGIAEIPTRRHAASCHGSRRRWTGHWGMGPWETASEWAKCS